MQGANIYDELKQRLRGRGGESATGIAETEQAFPEPVAPLNERLIQMIWQEQLLDGARLKTESGKCVRVIDPGTWTGERGPDFHHAELEIDNVRLRGDVEIHLDAADWTHHQHQRDFEYNTVILHVALFCTDGLPQDELQNGKRLERLLIEEAISPDLDTVRRTFAAEDTTLGEPGAALLGQAPCQQALQAADQNLVREFLELAGRQRVESKVARFTAQLRMESFDQVFYQAIMTAMGYKGGKTLFFLLAKRVPVEELKVFLRNVPLERMANELECVLLNVANLLPAPIAVEDSTEDFLTNAIDSASIAGDLASSDCSDQPDRKIYLQSLHQSWQTHNRLYADRILPRSRRWFTSVRPVNFPMRRLAGIAQLLTQFDFRRGLVDQFVSRISESMDRQPKTSRDFRREIKSLAGLFEASSDSYWAHHYSFNGSRTDSPMQLIGADRALSVLYNALLPLALISARNGNRPELEQYLWRLHDNFPALAENTVIKFMRRRLFGSSGCMDGVTFRLEKHSQALFQIFHECCSDQSLSCDDCVFGARKMVRAEV